MPREDRDTEGYWDDEVESRDAQPARRDDRAERIRAGKKRARRKSRKTSAAALVGAAVLIGFAGLRAVNRANRIHASEAAQSAVDLVDGLLTLSQPEGEIPEGIVFGELNWKLEKQPADDFIAITFDGDVTNETEDAVRLTIEIRVEDKSGKKLIAAKAGLPNIEPGATARYTTNTAKLKMKSRKRIVKSRVLVTGEVK